MDGQTVNLIDPAAIMQAVRSTFYPPPPATQPTAGTSPGTPASLPAAATTVDVYNGGGTPGLRQPTVPRTDVGWLQGGQGTIAAQPSTQVLYGTGAEASTAKIAGYFSGVTATAGSSVPAGHVQVRLGTDASSVPAGISSAASSSSPASSAASSPSATPTSPADNGQAGAPVTVGPNAEYGIPCVY